jgi:hypothetical protein
VAFRIGNFGLSHMAIGGGFGKARYLLGKLNASDLVRFRPGCGGGLLWVFMLNYFPTQKVLLYTKRVIMFEL